MVAKLLKGSNVINSMTADYGRRARLAKVLPSPLTLVGVIDDGFFSGPGGRLARTTQYVQELLSLNVGTFMAYPGVMRHFVPAETNCARIINLSVAATIAMPDERRVAISVESALRLAADAVAVHIVVGHAGEVQALQELAHTIDVAHSYSIPVLAVMYKTPALGDQAPSLPHLGRMALELDADMIKVRHEGHPTKLVELVETIYPVPVLVAGGPASTDFNAAEKARDAYEAGASGICFGRSLAYASDLARLIETIKNIREAHG
jgi:DhnA family fructose-bisphosphate aldolase class Ia